MNSPTSNTKFTAPTVRSSYYITTRSSPMFFSPRPSTTTSLMSPKRSPPATAGNTFRLGKRNNSMTSINPRSTMTSLHKSSSKRNKNAHSSILNTISDFKSKPQLSKAIGQFNSYDDKIKMVDLILSRRDELQKVQDQMRLENAAPIINKFISKFKIRKQNDTKRRDSFRKTIDSFRRNEGMNINPDINDLPSHPLGRSPTASNFRNEQNKSPEQKEGEQEGGEGEKKLLRKQTTKIDLDEDEIQKKIARMFLGRKMQTVKEKSPKALVFDDQSDEEPDHSNSNATSHPNTRPQTNVKRKTVIEITKGIGRTTNNLHNYTPLEDEIHQGGLDTDKNQKKSLRLTRLMYNLGSKTLEKDLYRFMVKHKSPVGKNQPIDILNGNAASRRKTMASIEEQAVMKFEQFKHKSRQLPFNTQSTVNKKLEQLKASTKNMSIQSRAEQKKLTIRKMVSRPTSILNLKAPTLEGLDQ